MKSTQFAVRVALATILSVGIVPALAQNWTERPYDPPVGSRWQIEAQTDSAQSDDTGAQRDQHVHSTSEFTIVEKLPDGFRVAFINHGIKLSGTMPGNDMANQAFGAIKDIEVRVRTDRTGKPLTVENIDEVKAAMRIVIDRITAAFASQPKVAAVMQEILDGFLLADSAQAAHIYIDEVPLLSVGQNTGLKPGAVLREKLSVETPLGGTLQGVNTTRLTAWDDKAGTARYMRILEIDKDAVRSFIAAAASKLAAAAEDKVTPKMVEMMKQIDFDITSETILDVEAGMTRVVRDNEVMTARLMGHVMSRRKGKTITVTPLPPRP